MSAVLAPDTAEALSAELVKLPGFVLAANDDAPSYVRQRIAGYFASGDDISGGQAERAVARQYAAEIIQDLRNDLMNKADADEDRDGDFLADALRMIRKEWKL